MKLIYCPECLDVKKVRMLKVRYCACGKSWGYYLDDDLTAVVGGLAVPLAIENDKLREAVTNKKARWRHRTREFSKVQGLACSLKNLTMIAGASRGNSCPPGWM